MKLAKEEIETLSKLILDNLKRKELITFKSDEGTVLKKIIGVITHDLKMEEELDKEVQEILSKHSATVDAARIDYRKMFNMIKIKLAKERGVVL